MRIGEESKQTVAVSFVPVQNQQAGSGKDAGAGKAVWFGGMNQSQSPIWQKKEQAMKQARKMVADAFETDSKVSEGISESRDKIKALKAASKEAEDELRKIEAQKAAWKEEYQVKDDSEEQQDLLLLGKRQASQRKGSGVILTPEEQERLSQIDQKGLTEYQQRCLEVNQDAETHRETLQNSLPQIQWLNQSISQTKIDMVKYLQMGKAQDAADAIMDAASKEVIAGLLAEARQHVDEQLEETKEKAEERKEKEEEEEEKIESRREESENRREQIEERMEQNRERNDQLVELSEEKNTLQDDVKLMLKEMGLLDEDIKGVSVDQLL